MKKNQRKSIAIALLLSCTVASTMAQNKLQWPKITQQNKPWTRWWWEGSAVDTTNLDWILNKYQKAGLGGMEITTIYGVKGQESKFIDFLSPKWMDMLTFTLKDAKKLGLGVDMAQASGWPFGGPWVSDEDASKYFSVKTYQLKEGEKVSETILFDQKPLLRQEGSERTTIDKIKEPPSANANLQLLAIDQVQFAKTLKANTVMAYNDNGEVLDITNKLNENSILDWTAPKGNWTIYAMFQGLHGKMVERAGPGGEGYAIDHFSLTATNNYLHHFDEAFKGRDISYLRSFFNDSYEVDDARGEADWTPKFLEEFKTRRGYDLRTQIPAFLANIADKELSSRVLTDYRETISDLLLQNYTQAWHQWAQQKGKLIRNQAHGSPANILDLYAATDIPEAEGDDVLRIKFASSAAHVTGKPLASSESATWENDHFLTKLGDVKKKMDLFLLGGINHTFYHGSNYTPKDAPWPGWLFYAAVHFTPNNSFYDDFPALNKYVAHIQSFMQDGKPDNEVLLYLPISDAYADRGNSLLKHFDGIEKGFKGTILADAANQLYDKGYDFDFISDLQILQTSVNAQHIKSANVKYKTLVVPGANLMPLTTLQHLFKLAAEGAHIVFYKNLPKDVPGLADLKSKQKDFQSLIHQLNFQSSGNLQTAQLGLGTVSLGNNISDLMSSAKIKPESMKEKGLNCIRRSYAQGKYYFIVNENQNEVEGWFPLATKAASIALFNPMSGQKGFAAIKQNNSGSLVYLQLKKGESCILQTFDREYHPTDYAYFKANGKTQTINGNWQVKFVSGGPKLPQPLVVKDLKSWTTFGVDEQIFSGSAAYTINFKRPIIKAKAWLLDLGNVQETVKVLLNGVELATLIGPSYQLEIPANQLKAINKLELIVSNGMANRISWMDRTNQNYRIFYNTNFPAHNAENRGANGLFTAQKWDLKPSGLLGPVVLIPLTAFKPQ